MTVSFGLWVHADAIAGHSDSAILRIEGDGFELVVFIADDNDLGRGARAGDGGGQGVERWRGNPIKAQDDVADLQSLLSSRALVERRDLHAVYGRYYLHVVIIVVVIVPIKGRVVGIEVKIEIK